MRLGRPKAALILTDEERVRLDSLAHQSRTAPHLARRTRIVLGCAEGHDNAVVAKRQGRTTIQQIWHAFRLQPHRNETFKLSKDPLLIEKVRDIVGLYMNPPDMARRRCLPPSTSRRRRSSRPFIAVTAPSSFGTASTPSMPPCRRASTCT